MSRPSTARHDQAAVRGACEGRDTALDLSGIAYIDRSDFDAELRCNCLNDGELADSGTTGGITKHCRSCHAWRNLLEQFQPFTGQAVLKLHEACDIATWPRKTFDEILAGRVDNHCEHDRHSARSPLQCLQGRRC